MEWLLLGLGAAAVAALVGWVLVRRARSSPPAVDGEPAAALEDAELEALFRDVIAESGESVHTLLDTRLELLKRRRVPVRAVRSVQGLPDARLRFADGTVLLARAEDPGSLIDVAVHLRSCHVVLASWSRGADSTTTRLLLTWEPEGAATVLAVGLDQEA